jgi:hypothetical protein
MEEEAVLTEEGYEAMKTDILTVQLEADELIDNIARCSILAVALQRQDLPVIGMLLEEHEDIMRTSNHIFTAMGSIAPGEVHFVPRGTEGSTNYSYRFWELPFIICEDEFLTILFGDDGPELLVDEDYWWPHFRVFAGCFRTGRSRLFFELVEQLDIKRPDMHDAPIQEEGWDFLEMITKVTPPTHDLLSYLMDSCGSGFGVNWRNPESPHLPLKGIMGAIEANRGGFNYEVLEALLLLWHIQYPDHSIIPDEVIMLLIHCNRYSCDFSVRNVNAGNRYYVQFCRVEGAGNGPLSTREGRLRFYDAWKNRSLVSVEFLQNFLELRPRANQLGSQDPMDRVVKMSARVPLEIVHHLSTALAGLRPSLVPFKQIDQADRMREWTQPFEAEVEEEVIRLIGLFEPLDEANLLDGLLTMQRVHAARLRQLGFSPLIWAVMRSEWEVVNLLLTRHHELFWNHYHPLVLLGNLGSAGPNIQLPPVTGSTVAPVAGNKNLLDLATSLCLGLEANAVTYIAMANQAGMLTGDLAPVQPLTGELVTIKTKASTVPGQVDHLELLLFFKKPLAFQALKDANYYNLMGQQYPNPPLTYDLTRLFRHVVPETVPILLMLLYQYEYAAGQIVIPQSYILSDKSKFQMLIKAMVTHTKDFPFSIVRTFFSPAVLLARHHFERDDQVGLKGLPLEAFVISEACRKIGILRVSPEGISFSPQSLFGHPGRVTIELDEDYDSDMGIKSAKLEEWRWTYAWPVEQGPPSEGEIPYFDLDQPINDLPTALLAVDYVSRMALEDIKARQLQKAGQPDDDDDE